MSHITLVCVEKLCHICVTCPQKVNFIFAICFHCTYMFQHHNAIPQNVFSKYVSMHTYIIIYTCIYIYIMYVY